MPRTGLTSQEVKDKAILSAESKIKLLGVEKMRLVDVAKDMGVAHTSLYNHFVDKTALLDSVSEKWTNSVDEALAAIAAKPGSSSKLIQDFFLTLHRMKRDRVANEVELFKAFDMAAEAKKPFIAKHIEHIHDALLSLVKRALAEGEFTSASPEKVTAFLIEIMRGFVHPKLVSEFLGENREPALRSVLKLAYHGLQETR